MFKILDRFFFYILILIMAVEALSFFAFFSAGWEKPVFSLLVLIIIILTAYKLEYGIYVLLAELFIGGLGYLFFWPGANHKVSIRLIIFLIIFLLWLVKIIREKNFYWLKDKFVVLTAIFLLLMAGAIWRANSLGRPVGDIFSDANAYLYWGLIGVFVTAKLDLKKCLQILLAASTALSVKTILILYLFSHQLAKVNDLFFYRWIRDTRVGEISLISDPLFRIYFQSHFYNLIALAVIIGIVFLIGRKDLSAKAFWGLKIIFWLDFLTLFISQTRSFWLVGLCAIGLFFLYLIYLRVGWKKIIMYLLIWPIMIISCHLAVNLLIGDWQKNIFYERLGKADSQAGITSRSAQLAPLIAEIKKTPLWGQGFGKNLTYQSSDPRIRTAANPQGWYTTYSFELGYLDIILKIGLIGLLVYASLIFLIGERLWQQLANDPTKTGLFFGLITLVVIHIFMPYLNHPLGIGYLLLLIGLLHSSSYCLLPKHND